MVGSTFIFFGITYLLLTMSSIEQFFSKQSLVKTGMEETILVITEKCFMYVYLIHTLMYLYLCILKAPEACYNNCNDS